MKARHLLLFLALAGLLSGCGLGSTGGGSLTLTGIASTNPHTIPLVSCGPTVNSGAGQNAWVLDALVSYGGQTTHLILDVADGNGGSGDYRLDAPIVYNIYIRDDASEAEIANFEQKLTTIAGVVEVQFLSKDQVEAQQSKLDPNYAAERAVLGYNALPAELNVRITTPNIYATINQLAASSGVVDQSGVTPRRPNQEAVTDSRGAAELRIDSAGIGDKSQARASLFAQAGQLTLNSDLRSGTFSVTVTTDASNQPSPNSLQGSFTC
jgi:hypothetical protein